MFRLDEGLKVYLHRQPIDFRLNINGLALMVEKALGFDHHAGRDVRGFRHSTGHPVLPPQGADERRRGDAGAPGPQRSTA